MSRAGRATNAPETFDPFTSKTVSVAEAAEVVGKAEKTIRRWCADDRIYFRRTASGTLRIYRDSLFPVSREIAQVGTSAASSEHRGEANAE